MQTVNLNTLPPRARIELLDFYESLLEKHAPSELPGTGAGKMSRWSKIAQRVHEDTRYPGGWSEPLKRDMRDFRENFSLKHDET
uniref:Addiction module component n=1 Tax=Candidatus Kentrum sp. DK TaxID=2126562 RepID=A0A450SIX6_9GAMM|nr:MAG: hypothetical protein BECKDK2373C_GA0170839_103921 [Candidatus Kentron sp. DK]